MSERDFCDVVAAWVTNEVQAAVKEKKLSKRASAEVWVRKHHRIMHGYIPAPVLALDETAVNRRQWRWHPFLREVDIVVGVTARPDDEDVDVPLLAMELKAGPRLNTDELDKKAGVYRALRELYPLVHTVLLHDDLDQRAIREEVVLRNARYFDSILWAWHEREQGLLGSLIRHHLDYTLGYWALAD